jgi:diaminopimelate epimerase
MINFTKMHGLGNDFVVIDAINQAVNLTSEQIRFMADRHFGIGFDQLLLVEKPVSPSSDFKYRIFNADGSEVAQCGNGARCFAQFVREKNLFSGDEIRVDTDSGQLILKLTENALVLVNMGIPRHAPAEIPLLADRESETYSVEINGTLTKFAAVSMGNPHAVIQVDDILQAPVAELGKTLESHQLFPQRVNVGFMQILDRKHIRLRVYERGAGETLACGSGACAAVVAGIELCLLDNEVDVELTGGHLTIGWAGRGEPVYMTGSATTVFDGKISLREK